FIRNKVLVRKLAAGFGDAGDQIPEFDVGVLARKRIGNSWCGSRRQRERHKKGRNTNSHPIPQLGSSFPSSAILDAPILRSLYRREICADNEVVLRNCGSALRGRSDTTSAKMQAAPMMGFMRGIV